MHFWLKKSLNELSSVEWEQLCDGCGKCCLNKVIDDDTDKLYYTDVACQLLCHTNCHCKDYSNRFKRVPECTQITPDNISTLTWLPDSCAYRRVFLGKSLPSWHPLLSGSKAAMHQAEMSVKDKVISETDSYDIEEHLVLWPLQYSETNQSN